MGLFGIVRDFLWSFLIITINVCSILYSSTRGTKVYHKNVFCQVFFLIILMNTQLMENNEHKLLCELIQHLVKGAGSSPGYQFGDLEYGQE